MLAATSVAPGHSKVVPLFPEFIAPQDGAEKQDCERKVKRWHAKHGERLSWLRPIYLGDDLFACQPIVTMLTDAGDDFIFTCKETSHKALYDFINGAEPERLEEKIRRGKAVERRRIAGLRVFRCATARTPRWSTGSALRFSTATAASNIPSPG